MSVCCTLCTQLTIFHNISFILKFYVNKIIVRVINLFIFFSSLFLQLIVKKFLFFSSKQHTKTPKTIYEEYENVQMASKIIATAITTTAASNTYTFRRLFCSVVKVQRTSHIVRRHVSKSIINIDKSVSLNESMKTHLIIQ